MYAERAPFKLVKEVLTDRAETAVPGALEVADDKTRRARRRRHGWMLVLAFEVLVFGAAQSVLKPIRPPGIAVEQTVKPNHIVT